MINVPSIDINRVGSLLMESSIITENHLEEQAKNIGNVLNPLFSYENEDDKNASARVWCTESANIAENAASRGIPLRISPFFNNDPRVRKPDLVFRYTAKERAEFVRCKYDVLHFAETHCYVMHTSGKKQIITLRPYQRRVLQSYMDNYYNILLSGRQIGKTVITAIFLTWLITFHSDKLVALLGDKLSTAVNNLDLIKEMIEQMPFFLKPGMRTFNNRSISLDNGSAIICAPCKKSALVGKTVTGCLYIDELDIPLDHQSREVVEYAMPTVEAIEGARIIFTSTPSVGGIFKEILDDSRRGNNDFTSLQVNWWEVDGRDLRWRARMIARYGIDGFNTQFNCVFPSNKDGVLVSEQVMDKLVRNQMDYQSVYDMLDGNLGLMDNINLRFSDSNMAEVMDEPHKHLHFRKDMTQEKLQEGAFVVTIDLSEGGGGDDTVANIYQVHTSKKEDSQLSAKLVNKLMMLREAQRKFRSAVEDEMVDYYEEYNESSITDNIEDVYFEQVGIWFANDIPLPQFSLFVKSMCVELFTEGKVRLLPEMNSGWGTVFMTIFNSDRIPEFELNTEEWIGWTMVGDKLEMGAKMKTNTRSLWITNLQTRLSTSAIRLTHQYSIDQLRMFKKNRKGRYEAVTGEHDDIVMTMVSLAGFMNEENPSYTEFIEEAFVNSAAEVDYEDW